MRARPLVILMHLSTEGRNPLATLFTGFIEGLILILLTVFFGASWGGNLLILCYVIAILLVTITLGRALGLWYVWQSARLFGLHVIETQSARQIIGCLRILCSMKEVLVAVNGSWWFEGHRLDERVGWDQWMLKYEQGSFDEDCTTPPSPSPTGASGSGSHSSQLKPNHAVVAVTQNLQSATNNNSGQSANSHTITRKPVSPPSSGPPTRVSTMHISNQIQPNNAIGVATTTNATSHPPRPSRLNS